MSLAILEPRRPDGYSREAKINHPEEFESGFAIGLEHFRINPWLGIKRLGKHNPHGQRVLATSISAQPVDTGQAHLGQLSGPVGVNVLLPGCLGHKDPVVLSLASDFNRQGTAIELGQVRKSITGDQDFLSRSHWGLLTFTTHDHTIQSLIFRNADLSREIPFASFVPLNLA